MVQKFDIRDFGLYFSGGTWTIKEYRNDENNHFLRHNKPCRGESIAQVPRCDIPDEPLQGSSFVANEDTKIFKPNERCKQAVPTKGVLLIIPLIYSVPFGGTLNTISLTRSDTKVANAGRKNPQTPVFLKWGFGGGFFFPPSLSILRKAN